MPILLHPVCFKCPSYFNSCLLPMPGCLHFLACRLAFKRWYFSKRDSEDEGDEGDGGKGGKGGKKKDKSGWAGQAEREAQAIIDAAKAEEEERRGQDQAVSVLHQVRWEGGRKGMCVG